MAEHMDVAGPVQCTAPNSHVSLAASLRRRILRTVFQDIGSRSMVQNPYEGASKDRMLDAPPTAT